MTVYLAKREPFLLQRAREWRQKGLETNKHWSLPSGKAGSASHSLALLTPPALPMPSLSLLALLPIHLCFLFLPDSGSLSLSIEDACLSFQCFECCISIPGTWSICVSTCMWCTCICVLSAPSHAHAWRPEDNIRPCSVILCLIHSDKISQSINLEPSWCPASPSRPPSSSRTIGVASMHMAIHTLYVGAGDLKSRPHSYAANTLPTELSPQVLGLRLLISCSKDEKNVLANLA